MRHMPVIHSIIGSENGTTPEPLIDWDASCGTVEAMIWLRRWSLILTLIAVALCMAQAQVTAPTAVDVHLLDVDRRLALLEQLPTEVAVLRSELGSVLWIAKGILAMLGGLLAERLLRAFGIRIRGTDK